MLTDIEAARERLRILDLEYDVTSKLIVAIETYKRAVAGSAPSGGSGSPASYRGIRGHTTARIARNADELSNWTGQPVLTCMIINKMTKCGLPVHQTTR